MGKILVAYFTLQQGVLTMVIKFWLVLFLSLTLSQAFAQEDGQKEAQENPAQEDVQTAEPAEAEAQASQEEVSTPSSGRVEKLEVTGSHIKRIDVEGPSPVLTLDREYLDRTGYNSVADVLRDNTVSGLGSDREAGLSGGADAGAATTSVRGMGADSVLVLLDGQRMPTIGGRTTVDLNLIPMAAIDRIEILKDGASAIYGSDALGGVINFITKKDYDGANIALTHSQPEAKGGARSDISASYGKSTNKYNFLAVGQYRTNKSIAMRDRDFFMPPPEALSPTGSPGSWRNHTGGAYNPGSSADPCNGVVDGNGRCNFDYSPFMNVIPDLEQFSGLISGRYKINDNLEFFGQALATRRIVNTVLAPAPDNFTDQSALVGGIDTRVPKAVADGWGLPPGATTVNPTKPGNDVDVLYRLVEEAGPRRSEVTTDNIGVTTGVKGYMGDTWDWELTTNYSQSQTVNRGIGGYANKVMLRNMAIADPNSFNPFAAPGAKSDISQALYIPELNIFSNIGGAMFKATGEVLEMPNGPLSLAVGFSSNWQNFEQTADAVTASGAQWGGGTSAQGYGFRDFQSAFAEFSIPLLADLELQAAGRVDQFSDFGTTFNPKLGFRYKPLNSLMFRGSWGTGFKAPALVDMYGGPQVGFPFGFDPIGNEQAQFQTFTRGNPNLTEETSESLNVGFIWQATSRFSFGADYYYNNQQNLVFSPYEVGALRDIFRAEAAGIDLTQYGIIIHRDSVSNQVDFIEAPALNLADRKTQGSELRLAYDQPLPNGWRINAVVDYSLILRIDETPFPGLEAENRVGFAGRPYWRSNTALGLSNEKWSFNTLFRTIGEQNWSVDSPELGVKTRDHTEIDVQAQYVLPWNASVSAGIRNLLNTDRPWQAEHLSNGFLNTSLYDPFGRTVFMNYSQSF